MKSAHVLIVISVIQGILILATLIFLFLNRMHKRLRLRRQPRMRPTSWFWWRRLETARMLAATGHKSDREILRRLLRDPNPAVQAAATEYLVHDADKESIQFIIDFLADRAFVVRMYHLSVLREQASIAAPMLARKLTTPFQSTHDLVAWIELAEVLEQAEPLAAVARLASYPDVQVRAAAIKALSKSANPYTPRIVKSMLLDNDWEVRTQAARSLGILGVKDAIHLLVKALSDSVWLVRFHAGLALASLGKQGRQALHIAYQSADRYSAEMAVMVAGLSSGAVLELSEE